MFSGKRIRTSLTTAETITSNTSPTPSPPRTWTSIYGMKRYLQSSVTLHWLHDWLDKVLLDRTVVFIHNAGGQAYSSKLKSESGRTSLYGWRVCWICNSCMALTPCVGGEGKSDQTRIMKNTGHWGNSSCSSRSRRYIMVSVICGHTRESLLWLKCVNCMSGY